MASSTYAGCLGDHASPWVALAWADLQYVARSEWIQAAIAFNTNPTDSVDAALRWLPK